PAHMVEGDFVDLGSECVKASGKLGVQFVGLGSGHDLLAVAINVVFRRCVGMKSKADAVNKGLYRLGCGCLVQHETTSPRNCQAERTSQKTPRASSSAVFSTVARVILQEAKILACVSADSAKVLMAEPLQIAAIGILSSIALGANPNRLRKHVLPIPSASVPSSNTTDH